MKILVINDKYHGGGAEFFSRNLKTLFGEEGHHCVLLTFDSTFDCSSAISDDYNNIRLSDYERYVSKIFPCRKLVGRISSLLKSFSPDLVIVNNIFDTKFSLLKSLKPYKSIRIVHDYSPFCIYSNALCDNGTLCRDGYHSMQCNRYCMRKGKISNTLKIWNYKRVEKISKEIFSLFIAPSRDLTQKLQQYQYHAVTLNNYIDSDFEHSHHMHWNPLMNDRIYLYIGKVNYNKGILDFIPFFNKFSQKYGGQLWIVGSTDTDYDQIRLMDQVNQNIKYLGSVAHDKILSLLDQAYCLLVPSRWAENYPTVILEAMLSHTLILGAARGGITEMLDDKCGILFHWEQEESLISALYKTAEISKEEYAAYIKKTDLYVRAHNRHSYYNQLMKFINQL